MIELDEEAAGHLLSYLIFHEREIALSIDDFGDLRMVFLAVLKREPEPN